MNNTSPLVTVVVPSYNQGSYLEEALKSLEVQDVPIEVFVMDGGSTDDTRIVLDRWRDKLSGVTSAPDGGQGNAINTGIKKGSAPFVSWLNSDDMLEPNALKRLVNEVATNEGAPFAYGRCWNFSQINQKKWAVKVEPFDRDRLASRCIISQPATLIRRSCWEQVAGLNEDMSMALDYDLWWRLYLNFGNPVFVDEFLATNRVHDETKTARFRRRHYSEAIATVRKHYGSVPLRWWLAQPYSVWFKSLKL